MTSATSLRKDTSVESTRAYDSKRLVQIEYGNIEVQNLVVVRHDVRTRTMREYQSDSGFEGPSRRYPRTGPDSNGGGSPI